MTEDDSWPFHAADFTAIYINPDRIEFDTIPPFFSICACEYHCRFDTCLNARMNTFCDKRCCKWASLCGNNPERTPRVMLRPNASRFEYTVFAGEDIEAEVIVGQYTGVLKLVSKTAKISNQGYLLEMSAEAIGSPGHKIIIDAEEFGNAMRFLNHSCDASTRFEEMCNGDLHIVAVVSNRVIPKGEEITVDYGTRLWFKCGCGYSECQHE